MGALDGCTVVRYPQTLAVPSKICAANVSLSGKRTRFSQAIITTSLAAGVCALRSACQA